MRISIIAATVIVLLTGASMHAATIEYFPFFVYSISGDGSTLIGSTGLSPTRDAFRWTEETGAISIGRGSPRSISYDGSVVVGYSRGEDNVLQSFRWSEETGMQPLSSTSGTDYAHLVSADGTMVVGDNLSTNDSVAWRWTSEGGTERLGRLSGYPSNRVNALSADGRVIVGESHNFPARTATRWTDETGWIDLGFLPSFRAGLSLASDVSADGSVVVGASYNSVNPGSWEVFRWTEETGMAGLGRVVNGYYPAPLVSDDGEVVTSTSFTGTGNESPHLVWDEVNGWRSFHDEVRNEHGLEIEMNNNARYIVSDISADRRKIVGVRFQGPIPGTPENTTWTGFLITLDTPLGPPILHGDYNKSGTIEQGDLDAVLLNWGAKASTAIPGWRYDFPTGFVDQNELDAVLLGWGNTKAALNASGSAAAVPEPSSVALLCIAIAALALSRWSRHSGF